MNSPADFPEQIRLSNHSAWRFQTRGAGLQISESEFRKNKTLLRETCLAAAIAIRSANWGLCRVSCLKRSSRSCWIVPVFAIQESGETVPLKAVILRLDQAADQAAGFVVVTFLKAGQSALGGARAGNRTRRSGRVIRKKSEIRFHKIGIQKLNRVSHQERSGRRIGRKGKRLGQLRVSRNKNVGGSNRVATDDRKLRSSLQRKARQGRLFVDRDQLFDARIQQSKKSKEKMRDECSRLHHKLSRRRVGH